MDGVMQRFQRFQWFQRLQRLQPRTWRKVIILLTLLALADGYLLTRAYVARNADTVVILATEYRGGAPMVHPPAGYLLGHTTLHYTGDTAHQIQRAIDTYPFLVIGDGARVGCLIGTTDHYYHYQFTFLLAGAVVEVADTDSGGCSWSLIVLGLPERATQTNGDNPLFAIYRLTNGAVPT